MLEIEHQVKFITFLKKRVPNLNTRRNYLSWLRRIARESSVRISPDTITGEDAIHRIISRIPGLNRNHEADARHKLRLYLSFCQEAFGDVPDLVGEESEAEASGEFNVQSEREGREKVLRSIILRRGQAWFRQQLLKLYDARCTISGDGVVDVLEAAHIKPYDGLATNVPENGLLLRADLHVLFDLGLMSIEPKTHSVVLSHKLHGSSYAQQFAGRTLRPPRDRRSSPSLQALRYHFDRRQP